MDYSELLGTPLKGEVLVDLFETYDVNVIYSYDRIHENTEDSYIAEIIEMGLEFHFNSDQELKVLFMKPVDHSGFNPFTGKDPRLVNFESGLDAMEFARVNSIDAIHNQASSDEIFGDIPEWVKYSFDEYFVHYQFCDGKVDLVTLHKD